MPSTFSLAELREAVAALATIEQRGREDDLQFALREATAQTAATDALDNAPLGAGPTAAVLARRLAALLGVPHEDAEAAAAEVFGRSRQRAIYGAILDYAAELRGAKR